MSARLTEILMAVLVMFLSWACIMLVLARREPVGFCFVHAAAFVYASWRLGRELGRRS